MGTLTLDLDRLRRRRFPRALGLAAGWGALLLGCEAGTGGLEQGEEVPPNNCRPADAPPVELTRAEIRPGPGMVVFNDHGLHYVAGERPDEVRRWPAAPAASPEVVWRATGTGRLRIDGGDGERLVVHAPGEPGITVLPMSGAPFAYQSGNGAPQELPLEDPVGRHPLDGARLAAVFGSALEVADVSRPNPPPPFYATLLLSPVSGAPVLRWPYLLFQGYDGDQPALRLYRVDDGWRAWAVAGPRPSFPVFTDDELLYLAGGQVRAVTLNQPEQSRVVLEGACTTLNSDGRRVVIACEPEGTSIAPFLSRNQQLYLYDHGQLRALEAGPATLPVLHGDWLAYYRYSPTDFGQPSGEGTLVLTNLRNDVTHVLGPVTHGCYACAAWHPLPRIHFTDELIAYDYDTSGEAPAWRMFRLPTSCLAATPAPAPASALRGSLPPPG